MITGEVDVQGTPWNPATWWAASSTPDGLERRPVERRDLDRVGLGEPRRLGHLAVGHRPLGHLALGRRSLGHLPLGHLALGHLTVGHRPLGHLALGRHRMVRRQLELTRNDSIRK